MNVIDFAINNPVTSTLIAAVIAGIGKWIWRLWCNYKDRKSIYSFLVSSKSETGYVFRTTEAVASHTKLTESRVEAICSHHPRIRRNAKEKQSWTLID